MQAVGKATTSKASAKLLHLLSRTKSFLPSERVKETRAVLQAFFASFLLAKLCSMLGSLVHQLSYSASLKEARQAQRGRVLKKFQGRLEQASVQGTRQAGSHHYQERARKSLQGSSSVLIRTERAQEAIGSNIRSAVHKRLSALLKHLLHLHQSSSMRWPLCLCASVPLGL